LGGGELTIRLRRELSLPQLLFGEAAVRARTRDFALKTIAQEYRNAEANAPRVGSYIGLWESLVLRADGDIMRELRPCKGNRGFRSIQTFVGGPDIGPPG